MARREQSEGLVTFQELAASNMYGIAAPIAVLEWKGLLTDAEVLEEIKRLSEDGSKAQ